MKEYETIQSKIDRLGTRIEEYEKELGKIKGSKAAKKPASAKKKQIVNQVRKIEKPG